MTPERLSEDAPPPSGPRARGSCSPNRLHQAARQHAKNVPKLASSVSSQSTGTNDHQLPLRPTLSLSSFFVVRLPTARLPDFQELEFRTLFPPPVLPSRACLHTFSRTPFPHQSQTTPSSEPYSTTAITASLDSTPLLKPARHRRVASQHLLLSLTAESAQQRAPRCRSSAESGTARSTLEPPLPLRQARTWTLGRLLRDGFARKRVRRSEVRCGLYTGRALYEA